MSDQLERLEYEVETALASFSADLSVEVPPAVLARVKSATRHEANEAWLADGMASEPAPQTLQRVRLAVRDELARSPAGYPGTSAWLRTLSSLSAAAMILICVGLIRYIGTTKPVVESNMNGGVLAANEAVDRFVAAAQAVFAETSFKASAVMDLDAIENGLTDWRLTTDEDIEALEVIGDEIDQLFIETESGQIMSGIDVRLEGAVG